MPGESTPRTLGMIESFQLILRAITDYAVVRFELAGLESRGALKKLVIALAALLVAILCIAAGFLYLSLSMVYVLAVVAGWGWGFALLASGVFMLIITGIGLLLARNFLRGAWFPTTLAELKKDTEWLKTNSTPNV